MKETTQEDSISSLLAEFGARLNENEEKHRLLKDRVMLIGENLISTKEDYEKESLEFKKQLNQTNTEIKELKQLSKRIVNEVGNLARKTELNILKRQLEMFEPLKAVNLVDVRRIVEQELKKTENKS